MSPKEIQVLSDKKLFSQKSTEKALKNISKFRDIKKESRSLSFHDNVCIFCGKDFHPRHYSTKYCSHECQRNYLNKKRPSQI